MSQPWIELRLWRQFVAVAETLHFGRAARALHMTQPPLTQAIAQLERMLGARDLPSVMLALRSGWMGMLFLSMAVSRVREGPQYAPPL